MIDIFIGTCFIPRSLYRRLHERHRINLLALLISLLGGQKCILH